MPYDKFEIKKITKAQNRDIPTEDELKKLRQAYENNTYTEGKKEVLRDFLFSCYASCPMPEFHNITYGDLKPVKLTINKIETTYYLLCNERQKTSVMYKIPIVSAIVTRLLEAENKAPSQKIFVPLTNQPTNFYLKEIMKDLKIDKTITFHRARTIAANRGIRDSIAERIMGHAKGNYIKDIYTLLHDEDIVQEMFDKWVVV